VLQRPLKSEHDTYDRSVVVRVTRLARKTIARGATSTFGVVGRVALSQAADGVKDGCCYECKLHIDGRLEVAGRICGSDWMCVRRSLGGLTRAAVIRLALIQSLERPLSQFTDNLRARHGA